MTFLRFMKNPAASANLWFGGVSSFEKKKPCGLFSV
jgi:hypothetical protein